MPELQEGPVTEPEYLANVMARFPGADMASLAALENAAARRFWGGPQAQGPAPRVGYRTPEAISARRALWLAQLARIQPFSIATAAVAMGVSKSAAIERLKYLEPAGQITRISTRPTRWHVNTEGRQG